MVLEAGVPDQGASLLGELCSRLQTVDFSLYPQVREERGDASSPVTLIRALTKLMRASSLWPHLVLITSHFLNHHMVGLVFQHVNLEITQTSLSIHLSVGVQVTSMSSYDQGLNAGLLNCREILYHRSHQGSMAPHSSLLAWRIPWTEEPGRLQSTGSHRVGHHRSNLTRLGHCEQCCSEHWVNISFQLEVSPFLDICQRVRLLDYMVDLFLVF